MKKIQTQIQTNVQNEIQTNIIQNNSSNNQLQTKVIFPNNAEILYIKEGTTLNFDVKDKVHQLTTFNPNVQIVDDNVIFNTIDPVVIYMTYINDVSLLKSEIKGYIIYTYKQKYEQIKDHQIKINDYNFEELPLELNPNDVIEISVREVNENMIQKLKQVFNNLKYIICGSKVTPV